MIAEKFTLSDFIDLYKSELFYSQVDRSISSSRSTVVRSDRFMSTVNLRSILCNQIDLFLTVDINHVSFKSLSRSWLPYVTDSILSFDHNTLSFSLLALIFAWLLIMSRWIVNQILVIFLLNKLLKEMFLSCSCVNIVVKQIVNTLFLTIVRNVLNVLKIASHVIYELTK